jgi:uncharacterized protein YjbI with pentapeptide repeats
MSEPSNRDGRLLPDWPICSRYDDDGCIGIRIGTTAYCLEHQDPEEFKAFLTSLGPGASLDLRGTRLSSELLRQLLAALMTDQQRPTIGEARFDQALFTGDADFREAQFSGIALFEGAQFSGRAWFGDAEFSEDVWFDWAQFSGDAWFGEAEFSGHAEFRGARFSEGASFEGAQFSGTGSFEGAQFSGFAWFEETQFVATTALGPLRADMVRLDGAFFGASVVVEVAARDLSMVGTRFEREATLRVRYADILLDGAAFAKTSSLAFAEGPFEGPFQMATPTPTDEQPASQQSSEPRPQGSLPGEPTLSTLDETALEQTGLPLQPRLLSLRRVDVTNLVLADLDLTWCLFRGAHNLDKLRIEGPKYFEPTPRRWRWTRRRTLAEERIWRQTRYPHEDWNAPSEELAWVYAVSGQPVQPPDPDHVAPLYRALRKAEEDAKYEPGAADFYYGEMEMRRHARGTPWVEKQLLWAYWLVSGYGLRGLRALISLLVVILGLAVLFQWIGFRADPPAPWYWGSVLYAAKSTLSLPVQEQLTGWGEVLRIFLRLTGPVLLGLALLSVRGRVKR